MSVRTRFAPSPTGFMHVGGVRTALFAWLVARQAGGEFLLRIEDTDRERHIEEAESHILESLKWLGLNWDGEIYRQSEHLDVYKEWARKLIDKGRAYVDPRRPEELDSLRARAKQHKKPFLFRDHRPDNPPSWDENQPLRLKSEPKAYSWHDEVMGDLSAHAEVIDDFIVIKSDGYPTYDFAHIVDDLLMGITHVTRSQEFASSIPKYLNLYEALDIEAPKLAMLPYVLAPDGKKKLSKRDGAKDVLYYQREGFLPEALINFLATLGWNDGTAQEIFSVEQLKQKFSLSRVQKSGARFDEKRLLWMNGQYIRKLAIDDLYAIAKEFWPPSAVGQNDEYRRRVLALVQERLKYLSEIPKLTSFFFEDLPINLSLINNDKKLAALTTADQKELLQKSLSALEQCDFSTDSLTATLNSLLSQTAQKPAVLFSLIRIATTWAPASPGLADTLYLLGKSRSLQRLNEAMGALENQA